MQNLLLDGGGQIQLLDIMEEGTMSLLQVPLEQIKQPFIQAWKREAGGQFIPGILKAQIDQTKFLI